MSYTYVIYLSNDSILTRTLIAWKQAFAIFARRYIKTVYSITHLRKQILFCTILQKIQSCPIWMLLDGVLFIWPVY